MGKTSKTFALLLTLIVAISCLTLLTVKSVDAQTNPNASVPEFTVSFNRTFYTVTAPDPVNGENVTQQFQNNTIQVRIDNRPYTSLLNAGKYHLFYNIRIRNSENDWSELYPSEPFYNNATDFNSTALNLARTPKASTSEFTIIAFYDYYPSYPPNTVIGFSPPFHFPPGTQLDVEVQAIFGVDSQVYVADHPTAPWYGGHYEPAIVVGGASGWSNAQSITMPEEDYSNLTPTVPEFSWLILVPLLVSLLVVAVIVRRRKTANSKH